jgi:diguanylate cyclase (GGDEF)-like protein
MKIIITDRGGQVLYDGSPDLQGDGVIIGSDSSCHIRLNKIGISSNHIQIRYNSDGILTLQDLQSPYGTIINGNKLQPGFVTAIMPGAYIELTDDIVVGLQAEADDIFLANTEQKQFPFFMHSNENFVRKIFADMKAKLPREHYQAIMGAEGELVSRVKELAGVLEVTSALNTINSLPRLLDFVLEMSIAVTGGERAILLMFNEGFKRLETMSTCNFHGEELEDDMLAIGPVVNKCFESGKAMSGLARGFTAITGRRLRSLEEVGVHQLVAVPLKELGSIVGVLYVDSKTPTNIMSGRAQDMLGVFATQAAVAIGRTKMFYEATTDSVTGVANHNLFLRRVGEEFCRAQRHQKHISLILMELDHFDYIGENYSEAVTNAILKETGKIFKAVTRIHDVVSRLSHNRFAMVLPETPFTGALVVAEKLRLSLAEKVIRAGGNNVQVTGSFGISHSSPTVKNSTDLLKNAERAIKMAIKRGGNQIA